MWDHNSFIKHLEVYIEFLLQLSGLGTIEGHYLETEFLLHVNVCILVKASIAVIKHHDQKRGKRDLGTGTEAEDIELPLCLLACSS